MRVGNSRHMSSNACACTQLVCHNASTCTASGAPVPAPAVSKSRTVKVTTEAGACTGGHACMCIRCARLQQQQYRAGRHAAPTPVRPPSGKRIRAVTRGVRSQPSPLPQGVAELQTLGAARTPLRPPKPRRCTWQHHARPSQRFRCTRHRQQERGTCVGFDRERVCRSPRPRPCGVVGGRLVGVTRYRWPAQVRALGHVGRRVAWDPACTCKHTHHIFLIKTAARARGCVRQLL